MARFAIKITLDDGTILDHVSASFPDAVVPSMIQAANNLGNVDSEGVLIKGPRAITYAVRAYITDDLLAKYSLEMAKIAATDAAIAQVSALKSQVIIHEETN